MTAAGNVADYGPSVHPHDARSPPGAPARQGGAARHQHLDVPRRQDRRARPERRGQVDAAADHRGRGRRLSGRVPGHARLHGRLPAAGAACSTRPRTCSATSPTASRTRRACSTASRRSATRWASPTPTSTSCSPSSPSSRTRSTRVNGWDLDRQLEIAMDALRLPARRRRRHEAVAAASGAASRCAGCCSRQARPAAARRADEPPRRRVGRVARAPPAGVPRHRRRGDPRPLLPRQRRGLDPRARPRLRHPVGRQLLELARAEGRSGSRRRRRSTRRGGARCERELEWIRMAPRARQAKGKARITAYDKLVAEVGVGRARARTKLQISIPPGPRLGDLVVEAEHLAQGLRRPAAHRRPLVLAAAAAASSASSARTARARPRCSACSSARSSPTPARSKVGPTVRVRVRRPVARVARRRQDRLRGDHRRRRPPQGRRPRGARPRVRRRLQLQGLRPAEARRRSLGRRAQPAAPRQGAADGRQRAAARRADQRPRRRHAARARRGAARVPRVARW